MDDGFLPTGLLGPGPSASSPAFVSNGLLGGSSVSTLYSEPCASVSESDTPRIPHSLSDDASRLENDGGSCRVLVLFTSGYIYKLLQALPRDHCHHRKASISASVQWPFLMEVRRCIPFNLRYPGSQARSFQRELEVFIISCCRDIDTPPRTSSRDNLWWKTCLYPTQTQDDLAKGAESHSMSTITNLGHYYSRLRHRH